LQQSQNEKSLTTKLVSVSVMTSDIRDVELKTGIICPPRTTNYNQDVEWSYKEFKRSGHKMTNSKEITFSLKHVCSCRKSLSPSHVNAILPAANAEDATPKPVLLALPLACRDALTIASCC